jgi:acyl dehydratase
MERLGARSVDTKLRRMPSTVIHGLDELKSRVGQELGVSDWLEVTQEAIDAFAEATGDHQWIHVDPERAKETAFGGTIAHGLYTLSLGPRFSYAMFEISGVAFGINYGYDKVRFPAPLPVGSKVRMRATLTKALDVPGGVQFTVTQTFEREGGDKPVCVAESLSRVYGG